MADEPRLPVTALVASRNEGALLERCLPLLQFCEEIIVIDLDSTDDTARIAERHGATVVRHAPVSIAEHARVAVAPAAKHEWLLFTDPDEVVPAALVDELRSALADIADDVAVVFAPLQFYVGARALRGTVWGGLRTRRLLVRRNGVELTPTVWGGTSLRPGFRAIEVRSAPELAIAHYWIRGYRDWLGKHRRYLELEPRDRADAGGVTGVRAVASAPSRSFYQCFVVEKGYRDGVMGFVLSLLWAWFRTAAELALLRELRRRR